MIPENFKILIDKLKKKTSKNEAIWSKTIRNDEFKLDLGKGAITIDMWLNEEPPGQFVDIAIINEQGEKVDSITINSIEKVDFEYLIDLHSLAKRSYFKVDETFKNIFKELDSDKVIGSKNKPDGYLF